jgi:hypothetical protein
MIPLMLTQVFPLEQWLIEGKPYIEWEQNLKGKWQKRDRSLRSFQAYLGLAYTLKQSGGKIGKSFFGSSLIRSHLYIWAVAKMRDQGTSMPGIIGDDGKKMSAKLSDLAAGGVNGSDKITRLLFFATRHLWKALLRAYQESH